MLIESVAGTRRTATLPAAEVHRRLQTALTELERAEQSAVLWFTEILHRRLYRELGYSSIQQYAWEALRFSKSKTAQFLRLSRSFEKLPALKASVASGELAWTKAREVVKVATARSESRWIAEAQQSSRRELERKVRRSRSRSKVPPAQTELLAPGPQATKFPAVQRDMPTSHAAQPDEPQSHAVQPDAPGTQTADFVGSSARELPLELRLEFTPEQYARYEALMERVRRQGETGSREELLLAALDALVVADSLHLSSTPAAMGQATKSQATKGRTTKNARSLEGTIAPAGEPTSKGARHGSPRSERAECTRVHSATPYQVVVYQCARCKAGEANTGRGRKPISRATLDAILCDARIAKEGEPNRSSVPPAVRRAVLERDGYRCRMPGCGHTRFLNVHHIRPRATRGPNERSNLVTLCASCHRLLHERAGRDRQLCGDDPSFGDSPHERTRRTSTPS